MRFRSSVALRLAALAAVCALSPRVSAQEPGLEVFYKKLDPSEIFQYKWKGKPGTTNAGVFQWEVPDTEFGTNGFDRNYTGYCAEVLVPMSSGKLYRFKAGSGAAPSNYGVQDHPNADRVAAKRATLVRELFGRHYGGTDRVSDPTAAVAFQLALWELLQETEPLEGTATFDLFAGDFAADATPDAAAPSATKAQEYLKSLTGDDSTFYTNPNTKGRELVRLQGIPNAEGVVGQSQYALRFAGGGGTGGNQLQPVGGAGGDGAGGGTPGTGTPTTGVGGGGVPAGGAGFFPGGGTSSTPPSTTPPSTTPPGGGTPPGGTPPGGTPPGGTPPVDGGDPPPTNSVPAPAGLLLGLLALGTVGSWRVGTRYLRKK